LRLGFRALAYEKCDLLNKRGYLGSPRARYGLTSTDGNAGVACHPSDRKRDTGANLKS
jgi:hypothetical protein